MSAQSWLQKDSGDIVEFKDLIDKSKHMNTSPQAIEITSNIPLYDGGFVETSAQDPASKRALMSEWTDVFTNGAGIIVIKNGVSDHATIDRATEIFSDIIEQEKRESGGGGDHFAKAGANDRVWNAVEKHCLADPDNFAQYYSSCAIAMGSEAWLGRGYQMTAQVNRVNPGGAAQKPHRDYHLGFMSPAQMTEFPAHVHKLSPVLTLQGAVAHCDMPIESGPTQFLPFSQQYFEGYLAFGRPEFQDYFASNYVQIPLEKGDVVFFNPAVMHGAGDNVSKDIYRMANLLQVSSAFGRAMETVNRTRMCKSLYPALLKAAKAQDLSQLEIKNTIASCAEGYSFPTNLDRDPPIGGLAPKTQANIMLDAIFSNTSVAEFETRLDDLCARQLS